jgi:hypothetical protein
MTTPRGSYGGGYYASSAFPDTPIYDSLVKERGTPQIAPIRVPMPYESVSNLPALPAALPALPPGPSHHTPPPTGYPGQMPAAYPTGGYQPQPQPAYVPPQATGPRYPTGNYPTQVQQPYQGGNPTGYDAVRPVPVPPRPVPPRPAMPGNYPTQVQPPYNGYNGQGY